MADAYAAGKAAVAARKPRATCPHRPDADDPRERVLAIIVGIVSIVLGILCFRGGIANGVYILSLFIGFSFLFRGIWQLVGGLQGKGMQGRGLLIFSGVLGIIAGIIVLTVPLDSLVVLVWITGIWLILMGIIEIVYSFKIKSATGN